MKRAALVVASVLALAACSFERADEPSSSLKANSCNADAACGAGELCMSGLCVVPMADRTLDIALQVTPLPASDKESPHPVLIEGLSSKNAQLARRVELPRLVVVSGRIRNLGAAIDAALTFTPSHTLTGIPAASVTASTTPSTNNADVDYAIQLSAGVDYRVLVRPVDASLPPFRAELTAAAGADLSLDFADLETTEQSYTVTGPADRSLLVRALDLDTGEPISSTATVTNGIAKLLFATEPSAYRLEIRAEESYKDPSGPSMPTGAFCDDSTPVYPIYSIADHDLPKPDKTGAIALMLPEAPARIRYEGTVALCPEGMKGPMLKELPVSLHSTELLVPVGSHFSASFDAKTSAQVDPNTNELSFCVQLLEGSYDVVVTPPTSTSCAIYAEHRLIQAPVDTMAASGARFELHDPAYLQATVVTKDLTPVAGATVDAIALGRSTTLDLGAGDQPLTRYNRSRQVVTGADGMFTVPVDLGSYDLQVKGPANSGFSWQVQHDINVGSRQRFNGTVEMTSPVMLSGRLGYPNDGDKPQPALAGAEVLAFAVIRDKTITPSTGEFAETSERALPIGKAMADADGAFMLLLPQDIESKF